jgi:stage II sporulation protein D
MLFMGSTYHRRFHPPHRLFPARPPLIAAVLAGALWWACPARADDLLVTGAGFGHGVGMSQGGALGYAQRGASYEAILGHYYTSTAIGRVADGLRVRVMIAGRVRQIPLETYVRGVVAAEVPASWPLAALEAQAVASRTYALTAHAGGSRFDVYADTRSQVYRGVAAQTPQTDAAVAATAGQVVTYAGRLATTYFFAGSGGRTESVENGFPGSAPAPWLRGVVDPYDRGPLHTWRAAMSYATAGARLAKLVRGRLRGIEVLRRGFSPRIVAAYVVGTAGRTLVSGPQLAARLGLPDSWAYFSTRTATGVVPQPDRSGWTPSRSAEAPPATVPASSRGAASAPAAPGGGGGTAGPA